MKEFIKTLCAGIIVGIANVIPGISGGTLAVVLNIYDRLINAISLNFKKLKQELPFLIPLGLGLIIGIFLFSLFINFLFDKYPMPVYFFFIGIIAGSIPMLFNKAKGKKPGLNNIIPFICGLTIMVLLLIVNKDAITNTVITQLTISVFIRLFLIAALAAIAMIIPGISGSLIMLILGVYATIMNAISLNHLNIPIIIPVALGVLTGIFGGAWIVRLLLQKVPIQTYAAILGLVMGSIPAVYPGFTFNLIGIISIVLCICGAIIAYLFSRSEKTIKQN